MNVLFIDPDYGKDSKGCACVAFFDGVLTLAWFERPGENKWVPYGLDEVVVEQPQQDERSRPVPPAVLMRLSWDGALLAGLYAGRHGCSVQGWTPHQWKGSEPKSVQHARMWEVLEPSEREMLGGYATECAILAARRKGALKRWKPHASAYYPKSFNTADLLDAAAMGCTWLGRMRKVG